MIKYIYSLPIHSHVAVALESSSFVFQTVLALLCHLPGVSAFSNLFSARICMTLFNAVAGERSLGVCVCAIYYLAADPIPKFKYRLSSVWQTIVRRTHDITHVRFHAINVQLCMNAVDQTCKYMDALGIFAHIAHGILYHFRVCALFSQH